MHIRTPRDSRGVAHVLIVVIILVVLGGIGFAGYMVFAKQGKSNVVSDTTAKAIANATCEEEDKNICKFMASFKLNDNYSVKMTSTAEGKTETSTYEIDGDKKSHFSSTGEMSYEMITIDGTIYTKASNGTWWKQKPTEITKDVTADLKPEFAEDDSEEKPEEAPKTTYKNLGKEACGNLTCHKYQVVDASNTDSTELIWFDTKDYQLRKMRSEGKDGSVTEQIFSYGKVSIKVPSPVKELGPNQYLMPGAAEPTTVPDMSQISPESLDIPTEE